MKEFILNRLSYLKEFLISLLLIATICVIRRFFYYLDNLPLYLILSFTIFIPFGYFLNIHAYKERSEKTRKFLTSYAIAYLYYFTSEMIYLHTPLGCLIFDIFAFFKLPEWIKMTFDDVPADDVG